jgi:hypothetical protein
MKKVLTVIGKVIKWYAIWNTMCLAFIGAGWIMKRVRKYPDESWYESDYNVFQKAKFEWKWFLSLFRN